MEPRSPLDFEEAKKVKREREKKRKKGKKERKVKGHPSLKMVEKFERIPV